MGEKDDAPMLPALKKPLPVEKRVVRNVVGHDRQSPACRIRQLAGILRATHPTLVGGFDVHTVLAQSRDERR